MLSAVSVHSMWFLNLLLHLLRLPKSLVSVHSMWFLNDGHSIRIPPCPPRFRPLYVILKPKLDLCSLTAQLCFRPLYVILKPAKAQACTAKTAVSVHSMWFLNVEEHMKIAEGAASFRPLYVILKLCCYYRTVFYKLVSVHSMWFLNTLRKHCYYIVLTVFRPLYVILKPML